MFIGVPKNGAIISCGYNVSFTTWHDDYQIRKQGEYTDYGIDIGFDKESEQLQLSVYMGGYGRRDTYDNGQTDVTG